MIEIKYCYNCEHIKDLEDSNGETIYFCMNAGSGAYLEEILICGNCELEDEENE